MDVATKGVVKNYQYRTDNAVVIDQALIVKTVMYHLS